jgi:hypothetical protein
MPEADLTEKENKELRREKAAKVIVGVMLGVVVALLGAIFFLLSHPPEQSSSVPTSPARVASPARVERVESESPNLRSEEGEAALQLCGAKFQNPDELKSCRVAFILCAKAMIEDPVQLCGPLPHDASDQACLEGRRLCLQWVN